MGRIAQIQQAIEELYKPERAEELKIILEEYLQGKVDFDKLPQELVLLLKGGETNGQK